MSLELPFSIKIINPLPVEATRMDGGIPYTSINQANLSTLGVRYLKLEVNINNEIYWYKDGISDTDLVLKVDEAAISQSNEYTDSLISQSNEYTDSLISQLVGGAPVTYDTLKKLSDEVVSIKSILGGTSEDADNVVNTITELMSVLSNYPEGTDLLTLLNGKVDKVDVYNALDCIVSGKVADARQLKVLNDSISSLASNLILKEDSSNKSNSVLDIESTSKFPVWQVVKNWCISQFKNILLGIKTVPDLTYQLIPSDNTKRLIFTNANPVILTLPTDSVTPIPVGSKIEYTQRGDGVITVDGIDVSIITNLSLGTVKGETRILTKIDTDVWTLEGNITPSISSDTYCTFIDIVSGNDSTGTLGNSSKPYKTLVAAMTAANLTTNYRTFEIVSDGTYYINTLLGIGNYVINSTKIVTLSFSQNANVGNICTGIGNSTNLKINIPLGILDLGTSGSGLYLSNNIMVLDINVNTINASSINCLIFYRLGNLNIKANLFHINNTASPYFTISGNGNGIDTINITKLNTVGTGSLLGFLSANLKTEIDISDFITTASYSLLSNSADTSDVYIKIGNATTSALAGVRWISSQQNKNIFIDFNNSIFTGKFYIESLMNYGYTTTLTGSLRYIGTSTNLFIGISTGTKGKILMKNLDLEVSQIYSDSLDLSGSFEMINCNIKAGSLLTLSGNPVGARTEPLLVVNGNNTFISSTPNNNSLVNFNVSTPITNSYISKYGSFVTNLINNIPITEVKLIDRPQVIPFTQPSVTHTISLNDTLSGILFTSSNPVVCTVPTNASVNIPIGSVVKYTQQGDGVVTVGGSGITFITNLNLSSVKGETRVLTKIDFNTWTLEGNISSKKFDLEYHAEIDVTTNGVNVLVDNIGSVVVTRTYPHSYKIESPNIINTTKVVVNASLNSNSNVTDNRTIDYVTNSLNTGGIILLLRESNILKAYTSGSVKIALSIKILS